MIGMEPVKLDPCPFCGGEAEVERFGTPRQSTIYSCTNCGCRLETGEEFNFGADWNQRYNLNTNVTEGKQDGDPPSAGA